MGKMNLLKANWVGKVGQTVGAKWKNVSTIRSFTTPAYTDTPPQHAIRLGFSHLTTFFASFTEQIKSLTALDTKGMSARNALISLNKAQISAATLDPSQITVSRGGLPAPVTLVATAPAGLASINATWTPVVGATISTKARIVVIACTENGTFAAVGSELNTAGTISIAASVPPSTALHVYAYTLDYRGSPKVGSVSAYSTLTSPAA